MNEAVITKEETKVGNYLKYTAGGILLVGGSALLIRYFIKKSLENVEQNKSLDEGTAATYAKQLKMAFENDGYFGTNMAEVRRVFQEIPTKSAFEQVEKSYQKQFGTPLAKDLSDELKSSEYKEMLSIKAVKPEKTNSSKKEKAQLEINKRIQWAKRFRAAFEYSYGPISSTDKDALKAILYEIPTQRVFAETAVIYEKMYHKKLMDDIKRGLHFWEFGSYIDIIKKKPLK